MDEPLGLTQAAYAKARGMKRQRVHQLVKDGRIPLDENGKVIVDQADLNLAALIDQRKANRSRQIVLAGAVQRIRSTLEPPRFEGLDPPQPAPEPGFQDYRTKREKFLAEQAELEYLEKVGALVSVDQVDREVEEIFTLVKSNVFRIIPKKSAILAAETDPGRIERLLTDALTQAFNESSSTLADDTADEHVAVQGVAK